MMPASAKVLCFCVFAAVAVSSPDSDSPASCDANGPKDDVALLQTSMVFKQHPVENAPPQHHASALDTKHPVDDSAPPQHVSALDTKIEKLAEFELAESHDELTVAEAKRVMEDVAKDDHDGNAGTALEEDEKVVMDLVDKAEEDADPETAVANGFELTEGDVAKLTTRSGHLLMAEEAMNGTFEGDMMPADDKQRLLFLQLEKSGTREFAGKPWTGGIMKYCLASDLANGAKKAWKLALKQLTKALPCIQYKDVGLKAGVSGTSADPNRGMESAVCAESPAVFVTSAPMGCWSYVGELDVPSQPLNLQTPGCDSVGTTIHEIAHALGMGHEQARPDRDEYVTINFANIQKGKENNFDLNPAAKEDAKRPYDILSLMHYGVSDFAIDPSKPTILVKPKAYWKYTKKQEEFNKFEIGNRIGLAQTDVDQFAAMYSTVVDGGCTGKQLSASVTCDDKPGPDGAPWKDQYGQGCSVYVEMEKDGYISSCKQYTSGNYCCDCGGGLRLQTWEERSAPAPASPASAPAPATTTTTTTTTTTKSTTVAPAPAPTACEDSTTYVDPGFGDPCSGWTGYVCNGFPFSAELMKQCPVACKQCKPPPPPGCSDDPTYTDPQFGDSCAGWAQYRCSGYPWSDGLVAACPQSCRKAGCV